MSKMAELMAKIGSIREKASGAIQDVPDNLIGFLLSMLLLTAIGLGILLIFGYLMTRY